MKLLCFTTETALEEDALIGFRDQGLGFMGAMSFGCAFEGRYKGW